MAPRRSLLGTAWLALFALGACSGAPADAGGGHELVGGAATGGAQTADDPGGSAGTTTAGNETAGGHAASAGAQATGGLTASAGNEATAGAAASAGASAGGGSGGGATVTRTATDYASRKWARWPIPNPVSLGLPHPMSFQDAGETVKDEVTGLTWEKTPIAQTMTWQAALDYCTGKGAGWSLPTRIELTSIVDNTQSGPKVGSKLFVFAPKAGWTWASTPWVVNSRKTVSPPLSWFINLSQGDSNNSLSQLEASAYARCVQVPATQQLAPAHYAIENGEVLDNFTGLFWQQADSGAAPTFSAADAAAHCAALDLNAHSWRLPSLNELASVVDDVPSGNVSPAVDHAAFPGHSKDQWYWSASPQGGSTAEQWTLSFEDGFTKHQPTSTLGIVQCVHD